MEPSSVVCLFEGPNAAEVCKSLIGKKCTLKISGGTISVRNKHGRGVVVGPQKNVFAERLSVGSSAAVHFSCLQNTKELVASALGMSLKSLDKRLLHPMKRRHFRRCLSQSRDIRTYQDEVMELHEYQRRRDPWIHIYPIRYVLQRSSLVFVTDHQTTEEVRYLKEMHPGVQILTVFCPGDDIIRSRL